MSIWEILIGSETNFSYIYIDILLWVKQVEIQIHNRDFSMEDVDEDKVLKIKKIRIEITKNDI